MHSLALLNNRVSSHIRANTLSTRILTPERESESGVSCYIYRAYGSVDVVWQNMNQQNQYNRKQEYCWHIKVTFLDIFPLCDQNSLSWPVVFDTPARRRLIGSLVDTAVQRIPASSVRRPERFFGKGLNSAGVNR